jgi:S-adenosylmethionine:tRNA ribosyltransferase-isomerase
MDVRQFDFELPERLIAQTPLPERTGSRLMTLDRRSGAIGHHRFSEFADFLHPGDVLVINDTRVIPARLFGVKADTGAKAEVLLLKELGDDRWEALVKPGKRLRAGAVIAFGGESPDAAPLMTARVEEEKEAGMRVLRFSYRGIFQELLDRLGHMPLPPYIKEQLQDRERYQTVYAAHAGSAAAPTAGLHFTKEYLQAIRDKGVHIAPVTLHVGLGTFRPVTAERVEEHRMHAEYFRLPAATADMLNEAKAQGRRVIAVGTTSVRTLETAAARSEGKPLTETGGWTDIFIYPGYTFRIVDAMLTNFHLPRSTLLMLVSAFAGRERVLAAYREAVREEYRFFSFGDAMFIY